jgi:DNA repair exonuclease SbcCD ATPase subunit
MTIRTKLFLLAICVAAFFILSFAQTPARETNSSQAQTQSLNQPANANQADTVANEIAQLRKSLQTLNSRLREISEKILATDSRPSGSGSEKQNSIAANLDLLSRAEQRAETLRKQLFELIEKETSLRTRMVQFDEDMRPENIERALSGVGTTRTVELRDTRRRALEAERRGVESLLGQVSQSRIRLEDDVKQADALVTRLRQRVLPLIDKEIEKINPN